MTDGTDACAMPIRSFRRFNYNVALAGALTGLKSIVRFLVFIAVGLATIIVGSFMIRGNMHMWDKDKDSDERD